MNDEAVYRTAPATSGLLNKDEDDNENKDEDEHKDVGDLNKSLIFCFLEKILLFLILLFFGHSWKLFKVCDLIELQQARLH